MVHKSDKIFDETPGTNHLRVTLVLYFESIWLLCLICDIYLNGTHR